MSPEEEQDDDRELPFSDQVIYHNPNRSEDKAVALNYDEEEDQAPRVAAKGEGDVAEKIIELADQNDIPIYEDEDLVEVLYSLDLDEQIPPALYEVVAEVFAFIYQLNEDQKEG
ncbi:MAG: EscU/YscU/HrcU family type III secretion system export apparatus switch protein [bacterium]